MKNKSQVFIGILVAGFLTALQAEHVVIVADSRGVSVEAEISYEDQRRFSDSEVQLVFRVYEHGSTTTFVDVPTAVEPDRSTPERKKVRGRVPDRLETVGEVELLTFQEKV